MTCVIQVANPYKYACNLTPAIKSPRPVVPHLIVLVQCPAPNEPLVHSKLHFRKFVHARPAKNRGEEGNRPAKSQVSPPGPAPPPHDRTAAPARCRPHPAVRGPGHRAPVSQRGASPPAPIITPPDPDPRARCRPSFPSLRPQSRRLVSATRRSLHRQPRPWQRQLLSPPCQKPPDNLLLRARPRARGCPSSHLCALDSSAVKPVASITSSARRRPPSAKSQPPVYPLLRRPDGRTQCPLATPPESCTTALVAQSPPQQSTPLLLPGLRAAPLLSLSPALLPFSAPAAIKGMHQSPESPSAIVALAILSLPAQAPSATRQVLEELFSQILP
uniref:Uncharacterized protein n=1 Tax=Setaria viridis TaxID=4556 RepID=A0A4U6W850_SETVI|nr:hypothetical protein SEVIR_1G075400v2 [Setaria viridis]